MFVKKSEIGMVATSTPQQPHQDCLECRLIGTGALAALSVYFAYLTHTLPKGAGITHRRFNICCSIGFAAGSVARWFA